MVRSAKTSARTACSPAFGLVALSRTSRAHSLIVCSPARASNCAYSSSVTLVLMDLVRSAGTELPHKINKFPYGNHWLLRSALRKAIRSKPLDFQQVPI